VFPAPSRDDEGADSESDTESSSSTVSRSDCLVESLPVVVRDWRAISSSLPIALRSSVAAESDILST